MSHLSVQRGRALCTTRGGLPLRLGNRALLPTMHARHNSRCACRAQKGASQPTFKQLITCCWSAFASMRSRCAPSSTFCRGVDMWQGSAAARRDARPRLQHDVTRGHAGKPCKHCWRSRAGSAERCSWLRTTLAAPTCHPTQCTPELKKTTHLHSVVAPLVRGHPLAVHRCSQHMRRLHQPLVPPRTQRLADAVAVAAQAAYASRLQRQTQWLAQCGRQQNPMLQPGTSCSRLVTC